MPTPINASNADVAIGNAFRNAFAQLLLNGATGSGGFNIGAVTPGVSMSALGSTLDMWECAALAIAMIAENTSLPSGTPTTAGQNPPLVPTFTNGAALTAALPAANWAGGLAIDKAGPVLCYCDGTNWRRADTNSATLP